MEQSSLLDPESPLVELHIDLVSGVCMFFFAFHSVPLPFSRVILWQLRLTGLLHCILILAPHPILLSFNTGIRVHVQLQIICSLARLIIMDIVIGGHPYSSTRIFIVCPARTYSSPHVLANRVSCFFFPFLSLSLFFFWINSRLISYPCCTIVSLSSCSAFLIVACLASLLPLYD